jgi:hypothetical protein
MTNNKLPEVGKRYKQKKGGWILTVNTVSDQIGAVETGLLFDSSSFLDDFEELPDQEPTTGKNNYLFENDSNYPELLTAAKFVEDFFKLRGFENWEFMGLRSRKKADDKVQEALKEAKEELNNFSQDLLDDDYADAEGIELFNALYKLVDALEKKEPLAYSNIQETPVSSKVDYTSKSIWKPISELPDQQEDIILIKYHTGNIAIAYVLEGDRIYCPFLLTKEPIDIRNIDTYYRLTDFINHQESLEKRIERLELLIKDK